MCFVTVPMSCGVWAEVVGDASTLVACFYVAWTIGAPMRKSLLPRQLWLLALADCMFALIDVSRRLAYAYGFRSKIEAFDALRDICIFTSVFVELHVAFAVAAVFWRSRRCMRLLSRSVWFCGALAVLCVVVPSFMFQPESGIIEDVIMISCACTTGLLYLVTAFRSCWYPMRERRRAGMMVCFFALSYVVTLLPIQIVHINPVRGQHHIANILIHFNGVANTLTYALNNGMARAAALSSDVLCDSDPGAHEFAQWAGVSNVRVTFSFREREARIVPRVHKMAARQTKDDMDALEANKVQVSSDSDISG